MTRTALVALSLLLGPSALADGLYVRPDGYWRAVPPQPPYCCSCWANIDPGPAIIGGIIGGIIAGAPRPYYVPGRWR